MRSSSYKALDNLVDDHLVCKSNQLISPCLKFNLVLFAAFSCICTALFADVFKKRWSNFYLLFITRHLIGGIAITIAIWSNRMTLS